MEEEKFDLWGGLQGEDIKGVEAFLNTKKDYPSLDDTEEKVSLDYPKEDIKTFQERIDKLDYNGLMAEFKAFHNLESTYHSLKSLINITKNDKYYSVCQADRFKNLDPDTQEVCLKVERLCYNILLRYLEEKPKYSLIKDKRILQSLERELYKNFAIRFSGIESDILKLFTGYGIVVTEKTIKYEELNKELSELREKEKNLEFGEKLISSLEYVVAGVTLLANALNIIDNPTTIATNLGSLASGKLGKDYLKYKKHDTSNKFDKKLNDIDKLTRAVMAAYIGEARRATEAYLGV